MRTGNRDFRDRLPEAVQTALEALPSSPNDEATATADLWRAAKNRQVLLDEVQELSRVDNELAALHVSIDNVVSDLWPAGRPDEIDAGIVSLRAGKLARSRLLKSWRVRRLLKHLGAQRRAALSALQGWATDELRRAALTPPAEALRLKLAALPAHLADASDQLVQTSRAAVVACAALMASEGKPSVSLIPVARRSGDGLAHAIAHSLPTLRGWACTSLSIKPNFPLEASLFDVAIIDEASQCSVAAALPVAYRAKRLLVVGDPNQLTPVVRLVDRQLDQIAQAGMLIREDLRHRGLDYGDGSAYLAYAKAARPESVRLLDEHYRCHPQIARWFNHAFYGDELHLLARTRAGGSTRRGLIWIDVDGETEGGERGGVSNRDEAEAVLAVVESEIEAGSTIGVVTPFASQARLIDFLIRKRFERSELAHVDLTVGTAHRLQGQERDLVVFSAVVALNTRPATARWVEGQRNLLNVAASRALQALVIVGHPDAAIEHNLPTLASLRKAAMDGLPEYRSEWMVHSDAERKLRDALWDAGLSPLVKPVVEGFELDFALECRPPASRDHRCAR